MCTWCLGVPDHYTLLNYIVESFHIEKLDFQCTHWNLESIEKNQYSSVRRENNLQCWCYSN